MTWRDCILSNIWMLFKMNVVCILANMHSSYHLLIYLSFLVVHCILKKVLGYKIEFWGDILYLFFSCLNWLLQTITKVHKEWENEENKGQRRDTLRDDGSTQNTQNTDSSGSNEVKFNSDIPLIIKQIDQILIKSTIGLCMVHFILFYVVPHPNLMVITINLGYFTTFIKRN